MQKVLGFGGFFFRSHDRAALAQWYRDILGIGKNAHSTDPEGTPVELWHLE